jgi:hypothetical protein
VFDLINRFQKGLVHNFQSIWLLIFFFGICIFTSHLQAQTEYHWTYPECSATIDNICAFEDRTLIINAIWCQEEEIEYQVNVVALESGVEVAEMSYDSTRLLFSFAEDDLVNLILRTADALQMVSLNTQLEEVAVHDLGLPYTAHIFSAVKLESGYLINSLSGSLVSFTVYSETFEVIDSHTMPEPTLAFPSKLTFAELLENGKVLVSLFCDRTIYLDLDNLENSQWLSVLANNCMYLSTMVYNPDFGGTFCAMTSMNGDNSDLDEIWMIFHDEAGTTSSYFTLATDQNLWAGASEIQENTVNYSALTRVITQTVDSADFAFYRTDLEGNLYFSYEHHTPDRWEYAPYLTETSEGFWLYSSDRANDEESLDAFGLYIPKSIVAVEESEIDFADQFVVNMLHGTVSVNHPQQESFEAILYDLQGRQLFREKGSSIAFQTTSLPAGVYVLSCKSGNAVFTKKIALLRE